MKHSLVQVCLSVIAICCPSVYGLTCLHCESIPQPRHCHTATRCEADEVCLAERSTSTDLFWLGCVKQSRCLPPDSTNNNTVCADCCGSDLCNAQACGEPGFPATRGPVCYACDYYDNQHPCTTIELCSVDEECRTIIKNEIGDTIMTSGCRSRHDCQVALIHPAVIVGKRSVKDRRSNSRILCDTCCSQDLCNNCTTNVNPCVSSPCQHGVCSSAGDSYQCQCMAGWTGKVCSNLIDYCSSTPCNNGTCTNEQHGFQCRCNSGWTGRVCDTQIDYCTHQPCFNGTCINEGYSYRCQCNQGWTGRLCQTSIDYCSSSPCLHGTCSNERSGFSCRCTRGWTGQKCDQALSFDCLDVLHKGVGNTDGIYTVRVNKSGEIIQVYCDMTTGGGGWTVFQIRFNGSVDFYRNFSEYTTGFGSLSGEFWLGLKYVYIMTEHIDSDLRLDLGSASGRTAYEVYQNFSLSAHPSYNLHIGSHSGTAGDSGCGLSYHNGYPFSTFDRDNPHDSNNCSSKDHGGWWYNYCTCANLNGEYVTPGTESSHGGVMYYQWTRRLSLKWTEMKFRRK